MAVEMSTVRAPRDTNPTVVAPVLDSLATARSSATGLSIAYDETFDLRTRGLAPAFFDVTEMVRGVVRRSGVVQGQVLAAMAHTTCALIVQENEPLLLADLADRLCRFANDGESFRHNDMDVRTVNVCSIDECANGHSHCQQAILGASVSLPARDGDLVLGLWQRILLVELDHPRPRRLQVQVTGIAPSSASTRTE